MTSEEARKEIIDMANALQLIPSTPKGKAVSMAIKALEQETKSGHWIIIDDCEKFIAKCSECGRIEDSRMISKYPYCHCGAKMESEDKECTKKR